MLQNIIFFFIFHLKICKLGVPECQRGYKVTRSCTTFKQEPKVRSSHRTLGWLVRRLIQITSFSHESSYATCSETLQYNDHPQKCKNCHQNAAESSDSMFAERTSSSVRSLFSKGAGLRREGAFVCVSVSQSVRLQARFKTTARKTINHLFSKRHVCPIMPLKSAQIGVCLFQ